MFFVFFYPVNKIGELETIGVKMVGGRAKCEVVKAPLDGKAPGFRWCDKLLGLPVLEQLILEDP